MTAEPSPPTPRSADPGALIGQALRAQVGGPKAAARPGSAPGGGGDEPRMTSFGRLTTAQILLLAANSGLVIGMGAAFVVIGLR